MNSWAIITMGVKVKVFFVAFTAVVVVGILLVIHYGIGPIEQKHTFSKNVSSNFTLKKIYVITESYGGQMTRAIRNMIVQQCWVGTLQQGAHVGIVEPFSMESELVHGPLMWKDLSDNEQVNFAARLSDYYDLTYYNKESAKFKYAPLISWSNFLDQAPRKAIVATTPIDKCEVFNDWKSECSFSKGFDAFVGTLNNMGFEVIRNVCLTCSSPVPFDFKLLFNHYHIEKVSIFMSNWRSFSSTSSWLQIPDHCKYADTTKVFSQLSPSPLILRHSKYYIDNFITKKHYIAIMLRIERFLGLGSSESVQSCLSKILSLHRKMSLQSYGTYITVDIGKYGSGIMKRKRNVASFGRGSIASITRAVKLLFKHIYNGNFSLNNWEDSFVESTGGIEERGYIAMLQRNIAIHSDCLILMGGGSFQEVAALQYLNNHKGTKKPCLHTLCVSDRFNKHLWF